MDQDPYRRHCHKRNDVTAIYEVNLDGFAGEIGKLVIVLTDGTILLYDFHKYVHEVLGPECERRSVLLQDVEREIGYVEEKLKTLKHLRRMLEPSPELTE